MTTRQVIEQLEDLELKILQKMLLRGNGSPANKRHVDAIREAIDVLEKKEIEELKR